MNVIKYLLPPLVNSPFISHTSEWISYNGAKSLAAAALRGLRDCFDSTQTWHLEPLTKSNFRIKFKLAKRVMQPKLI